MTVIWPVDWNTNCLSQLGNYALKISVVMISKEELDHSQFNT